MGLYLPDELFNQVPVNRACINQQWVPYVLGLLYPGSEQSYWTDKIPQPNSQADRELMAEGILRLQNELCFPPGACADLDPNCENPADTEIFTDFRVGDPHGWTYTWGNRVNGVGVQGADTGYQGQNIQRANLHLNIAFPYCLKYLIVQYDWHSELFLQPSPPHGGEISVSGKSGLNWQQTMVVNSNDNLNGFLYLNFASGLGPAWVNSLGSSAVYGYGVTEVEIDALFGNFGSNPHEVTRLGAIKTATIGLVAV